MDEASGRGDGDRKARICDAIDDLRGEVEAVAAAIHCNPELGYEEVESSRLLCELLEKRGLSVRRGVAGMETAFVATAEGMPGGATVALLAEYDALPGIGHGCGHNLIGAAAAAGAVGLLTVLDGIKGRIVVVGCPAEEAGVDGAGGKARLVDAGVFDGMDAALLFHPFGWTTVGGESSALVGLQFEFAGRAAHAAGNPWDGLNALDAVIQTFNGINALRQHLHDDVRVHGIITAGGEAPNIVPKYAAARFFVRASDSDRLSEVKEKVEACARGAALATGTDLSTSSFCNLYDSMKTNSVLADVLKENLAVIGLRVHGRKVGKGSSDLGNVSRVIPACEIGMRIAENIVPHTEEFAQAAASKGAYDTMIGAAKVMAMSALDLIVNPGLVARAREEFLGAGSEGSHGRTSSGSPERRP